MKKTSTSPTSLNNTIVKVYTYLKILKNGFTLNPITFLIIVFYCQIVVYSQPCLPEGIHFTTQTQIDSFQINYPGCTEIEGYLSITGNNITNLIGLYVLTTIYGDLWIYENDSLKNLMGLNNITSIGGQMHLTEVDGINNLSGLEGLTTINDMFTVTLMGSLINLSGLNSLSNVGGDIFIHCNPLLSDLSGMENLMTTGGGLSVHDNDNLIDLSGLENIHSIGGFLFLHDNDLLESLEGVDSIQPASITNLSIIYNVSLSTCAVQSVCEYLVSPNGQVNIFNNDNGCNSVAEVEESCLTKLNETIFDKNFVLQPNPAHNYLLISGRNKEIISKVTIYNLYGQAVLNMFGFNQTIDLSKIPKAVYIIEIHSNELIHKQKIIKN